MKSLCVIILALVISQLGQAEPRQGVRSLSLGGADRALASSNSSIFYNPAGIIKQRRFRSEVEYLWEVKDKAHGIGLSLVDSQTGAWGLGLAYSGNLKVDKKTPNAHLLCVSAAMPIVSDILALGITFSYRHDRALGPEPYVNFFNINAGVLVNLPLGLSMGAVVDNIIKAKGNEKNLGLALAAAYDFGVLFPVIPLALSFDWLMDDIKNTTNLHHVVMAGLQYKILNIIPLRLGYHADLKSQQKLFSIGLGLNAGIFSLDGLYQQNLKQGEDRFFGLALGLNF
jgi:hypothetical protein